VLTVCFPKFILILFSHFHLKLPCVFPLQIFFSPLFQNTFYCWCISLNSCLITHTVFPKHSIVKKFYVICRGFWKWDNKRNYKMTFSRQHCWRFKYSGMCCFVGEYFLTFQRIIVSEDTDTLILSKRQEMLTKGNNVTSHWTWVYRYDYVVSRLCPLSQTQKRTQGLGTGFVPILS